MDADKKSLLGALGDLESAFNKLNNHILEGLKGKSIEQIKDELKDDTPGVLQHLHDIAFEAEQFEVCAAVKLLIGSDK